MATTQKNGGGRREKRERNPEETKRRILDSAEDEFARKGYDGARLRDVAEAAGVHHALLHHYFGDKEGLFHAVVERAFGAVSSRALEVLRTTADVNALLERYVSMLVDFHGENPNLVQIVHFASLDPGSPAFAVCERIGETVVMPLLDATAKTVAAAQKSGVLRADVDAKRLVVLSMGVVAYLFHEQRFFESFLGKDPRSPDALAEHKDAALRFLAPALFTPEALATWRAR